MDERTQEVINRFRESWVETKAFYSNLINNYEGWDKVKPIKKFIAKIISAGEDKFYRAGTSVHTLVLSRSVNFGLREDQKELRIEALATDDFEVTFRMGFKAVRQYRIKTLDDERLVKLMRTLADTLID